MSRTRDFQDLVKTKTFASMGNSGRSGQPYQESYFADDSGAVAHRRGGSRERLEAIVQNVDVRDKFVLDVGCNIGFFCFGLAEHGARTLGIDYDQDSIDVADAMRVSHSIERARFMRAPFDRATAEAIRAEHGVPDIILLNSVVHWLMYAHDSLRRMVDVFQPLLSDRAKQIVVYEPSSTGVAYYPELLSDRGVQAVLRGLGVLESRCIGEFPAVNARQDRRYFLGERDVPKALAALGDYLHGSRPSNRDRLESSFGEVKRLVERPNKLNLTTAWFFIKTTPLGRLPSASLVRREADVLARFKSAHAPDLVLAGPVGDVHALACRRHPGKDLSSGWIDAADVPVIEQQICQVLDDLQTFGVAHNDFRPENLLWDAERKHLTLLDYEFCTPLTSLSGDAANDFVRNYLLELCGGPDAAAYIDDRLRHLGGTWRSSYGLGTLANDRYSAKKIIFSLKNRRSYVKRRVLSSVAGALPPPVRGVLRALGVKPGKGVRS
jgi:SAM-dependent methyltransferase